MKTDIPNRNRFLLKAKELYTKEAYWSIAVILLTLIIVYTVYFWQDKIDIASNSILLILQISALLLISFFILAIIRSFFSKKDGTLFLPFDTPPNDQSYNGKAIVDALIAESCRLHSIVSYDEENISEQYSENASHKSNPSDIKQTSKKQAKIQSKQRSKLAVKDFKTPLPSLDSHLTNITVKVGESTFSLHQFLIDIKKLWSDKKPQYIITGSLQKFSNGLKLIVRREGENIDVWEAWSTNPDKPDLLEIVQEMALKMTNTLDSLDNYKLLIAANEQYRAYKRTNDKDELQGACDKIITALSTDSNTHKPPILLYKLFFTCYQNNEFRLAYEICNLIFELGEGKIDTSLLSKIYNIYAGCCEQLSKFEKAEVAYYDAIRADKEYLSSYYYLTILYSKIRELDGLKLLNLDGDFLDHKIMNIIDKAIQVNSIDSYTLAEWYKDLELFPEAKREYLKAIKQAGEDVNLYWSLGNTFQDLGENEFATEFLTKAAELAKRNKADANFLGSIYNDLALSYSNRENSMQEAVEFYKKAIEEDPLLAIAYSNLGIIFEANGQIETAFSFYSSAFTLDSYSINFATQLALLHNRLDYHDEAIRIVYVVIDNLGHTPPELHSILSLLYRDKGELEQAVEECQIAIHYEDANPYYHRDLGYLYLGQNFIELALREFNRSKELDPNLRYTWAAKAGCLKRLNRMDEFYQEVEGAMQLEIEPGEDEYTQASFEALCDRRNEALKHLEVAIAKRLHTKDYVSRDWDFDFIKDDPGFIHLISAE